MKKKERRKEQEKINNLLNDYDMSFENDKIMTFVQTITQMTNKMQRLFEFSIKFNQFRIFNVLHSKQNLIIIAKTKFEKSFLYQMTSFFFTIQMCVLIIMLLLTLKKEQCEKMINIKDCKLIVLNDNNNNKKTRINIEEKDYTHNKLKDRNF